jgi:hypothetical protein
MQRIFAGSTVAFFTLVFLGVGSYARGQVVQLPTFRVFSMSTTVSVPDRGGAYLGGISSSSIHRRERGVPGLGRVPFAGRAFGNRTVAGHTRSSGVSVSAYIHDFEAMEEDLLRKANPAVHRAAPLVQSPDAAGRASIAELRRQVAAEERTGQIAARQDFERGSELLRQGRADLAKVYFQRAAKRGDAELRAKIAAILRRQAVPSPLAQSDLRSTVPR